MSRALSPVIGVLVLTALTVVLAASVGAVVATEPVDPAPVADLRVSVDAGADQLTVRHAGGDAIPTDILRVRLRVAGTPVTHQPPVPFFAARGFRSGPTGPFNPAAAGPWTAGETATLRLASTNSPGIDAGDPVHVTVATDGALLVDRTVPAT